MKIFSILLITLFSSSLFSMGIVTYTYDTDLNKDQQGRLNTIKAELYAELSGTNKELRTAKQELEAVALQRNVDESKASSLIEKISKLEKAKLSAEYAFTRNVRTFLNDKQIKANDIDYIPATLDKEKVTAKKALTEEEQVEYL